MNNSPSYTSYMLLLLERYHQNCLMILTATCLNGLTLMLLVANDAKNLKND